MQKFTNHFYRRKRNFTNSDTASVKFVDPDKLRVFHEPVFLVLKRGFIQEQNNMCSSDCYSSTCIISTFMTHFYFAICFDDIILLIQFSFSIPIDIGSNLLYFYLNKPKAKDPNYVSFRLSSFVFLICLPHCLIAVIIMWKEEILDWIVINCRIYILNFIWLHRTF